MTVNDRLAGRAYGSRSPCHRKSHRLVSEYALSRCFEIRSGQPLSDAHFQVRSQNFETEICMLIRLQSFMYQTLCGLKVRPFRTIVLLNIDITLVYPLRQCAPQRS